MRTRITDVNTKQQLQFMLYYYSLEGVGLLDNLCEYYMYMFQTLESKK